MTLRVPQTVRRAIEAASIVTGVPVADICARNRDRRLARIRFGIMHVAHHAPRRPSVSLIGRVLGRDHSTVIHGLRRAAALIEHDPAFAAYVDALEMHG